jgi:hypothetical protein
MSKRIYADFSYLILLAASFGAVMVLGVIVAAVIFHTDALHVDILIDRYNAGVIMGEIFLRFSYMLYFVVFSVALYEAAMYKTGQRDKIALISAFFIVATSLMFSGVYVPKILELQVMGREATSSDTFDAIHVGSEIDFKILAVALLILFVRRLMLLRIR